MAEIGAEGVDALLVAVERERIRFSVLDPEGLVEAFAQGGGALPQADCEVGIVPDVVGELSRPDACVVDVPLHLGRCDRCRGKPPVAEAL